MFAVQAVRLPKNAGIEEKKTASIFPLPSIAANLLLLRGRSERLLVC